MGFPARLRRSGGPARQRRGAEIGRQAGLRIQCPRGHESSSLSRGTCGGFCARGSSACGGESPSTHGNRKINGSKVETSIRNTAEWEREIEITVDAEELAPHFQKAYEDYRKKIAIKGFRKGKAPLDMIKRIYGESIEHESLDTVANELYRQAADEKKLKVLGEPSLVDIDYKRGESLRFKVKYEVRPEIQLKKYKGLKVEKFVHQVDDKELDAELERLRHIHRTTTDVEKADAEEHILTVDLQEVDPAGFPIVGKRSENVRLYLKDESLYPQMKEALRGAEKGKEYRAKLESAEGNERPETHLLIKVKRVEKVNLPDLNDEFVAKVTKDKVTALKDFRESVRKDLEDFWRHESERKLRDAIIDEIIKSHDFAVPEGPIKFFLDSFIEEIRQQQSSKQLPANFNEEEFRKENRAYAIYQAKWLLLKEKMVEAEGITVSDADLETLADEESKKIGVEKTRLLNYYKTSKSANSQLLSGKLMKFLVDHAEIQEKVIDESKAA